MQWARGKMNSKFSKIKPAKPHSYRNNRRYLLIYNDGLIIAVVVLFSSHNSYL